MIKGVLSIVVSVIFLSMYFLPRLDEPVNEIDLSGNWKFQIDSLDEGIMDKWFNKNLEDLINLPGSMTLAGKGNPVGYDTEFTGNTWKEYEEGKNWVDDENYKPYLSEDKFRYPFWLISDTYYVGAAWYQKEVDIPEEWDGSYLELFLERCHWETQIWVNETNVGINNALGVPHRYDLTKFLRPGMNTITMQIDNRVKEIQVGDDAHSVSDNTQSNWNGVIGEMKIFRKDPIFISDVAIFPDLESNDARLVVGIENKIGTMHEGKLMISASKVASKSGDQHEVTELVVPFKTNGDSTVIEVVYPLGSEVELWDEYNPTLYDLKVTSLSDNYEDVWMTTTGFRDISVVDKSFTINGRPTFLRGTLECAIFPDTGFPPTDVASWERIIKICKDHGLNHIRFHSWCPPRAAFIAADKLGFYFQVEASAWASIGEGNDIDRWLYEESERMVDEYGNHPSFALMAYGNEPGGNHKEYLKVFVDHWKRKDNRRVYTSAAGWPIIPENDFHNVHSGTRIQGWNQNLNSVINKDAPRSDYDWEATVAKLEAPMISHEIGQWCVYPNFQETAKYTGVLKATNFEIFEASLKDHGLHHLAEDFLKASGKLQALCYKADIEAALRTKGFGGFQLLDLHDFPGQGTALVGVLDPFWDEKGYISPEEFREFCNETVPIVRFEKMIFTDAERVRCSVEIAHYGENELKAVVPGWKITDKNGQVVKQGDLGNRDISWGHCINLGEIDVDIKVENAGQFVLEVEVGGFTNSWDFWVYPESLPEVSDDILVVPSFNQTAIQRLEEGGHVLLTTPKGTVKEQYGGEVAVGFSSIFWNTAWTNGQKPHTLGILCDPEHPALAEFPTEYHSNFQWWDAMSHSNALSLEGFDEKPEPIVRIIDDWVTNRNLALIYEIKIGQGKLLIAGVDLLSDLGNRPEARQLIFSLKKYMASKDFDPDVSVELKDVQNMYVK